MALYIYRKKDVHVNKKPRFSFGYLLVNSLTNKIQTEPKKTYQPFLTVRRVRALPLFRFFIPLILIFTGFSMLYSQAQPYIRHFVLAQLTNSLDQEIISAVPKSYEEQRFKYITDPGASYFKDYMERLTKERPQVDSFSKSYTGTFYLSIEEIGLVKAPVKGNVDSSNNEQYIDALAHGLGHMKGTKIPGAQDQFSREVEGNIFIYGHSASGDYAQQVPNDPVTAFTNLFKLNIGDTVVLERDGVQYHYVVNKIKEVSPDDTEVVDNISGNTLTLMTCSPPGLALRRLIVVAKEAQ